ncbi:MAG TPA: hypothetical protein VGD45_22970 [Steroidobacter sp.]|uniref:hypothetical protein n=1 Tax=Steroidobacter sp. TaxID=1978227 RepID=UPI002ED94C91
MPKVTTPLALLLISICAGVAADNTATNNAGALKLTVSTAVITNYPGYPTDTWLLATLGLNIENTGTTPVRIALLRDLSLQMEDGDGATFKLGQLNGLADCRHRKVAECDRESDDFEVLARGQKTTVNVVLQANLGRRPLGRVKSARVSGSLFIKNQETGQSWPLPVSVTGIPVTINL